MPDFRDVTLSLHGLEEYSQEVDGEVFALKFAAFMRGLGKSDVATNGTRRHRFPIRDLRKSSAIATVREQVTKRGAPAQSGIGYYLNGLSAIYADAAHARALPRGVIEDIASLPKGVGRTFAFAEVKGMPSNDDIAPTIIRVDEFLEGRAKHVLQDVTSGAPSLMRAFEGTAFSSFDGILKAVDLRGDMQKAFLLLSAGGKPIECIVNTIEVGELGGALDKRVIVYGLAHYDRKSGLPSRLDVRRMQIIGEGDGLRRWRGCFDIPLSDHDRDGWNRS
jgi:hypothetical protein